MKDIKTAIDALDDGDGTIVSGVTPLLPYEAPKLVILGAGHGTRGNKSLITSDESTAPTTYGGVYYSPS